ncbi:HNH endonuclease signature motif containing protein [Rhodotorula paludigena]|uniref:HNH endonuclease signature motif containing protein n=1 Tax=Rhodotorula paludigena TaxID=86838 RepID=UPI003182175F
MSAASSDQPLPSPALSARATSFESRYRAKVSAASGSGVWDWSGIVSEMSRIEWPDDEVSQAAGPWSEVMHVLYEVQTNVRRGTTLSVRPCVLSGTLRTGKPDSAHIVPDARGAGDRHIDFLIQQNVVPGEARYYLPSNRLPLAHDLHVAFKQGHLDFLPSEDAVLARLACEFQYQLARHAQASSPAPSPTPSQPQHELRSVQSKPLAPVRPAFALFYACLEHQPALLVPVFGADFTSPDIFYRSPLEERPGSIVYYPLLDRFRPPPTQRSVPPFLAPVSANLLIWAMKRRIRQLEPASLQLQKSTALLADAVALLDRFWHLCDANVPEVPALLEQTRKLITVGYPSSPYVGFFSQIPSLPFDYSSVPLPVAPDGTRTTVGTTPGKPAAADLRDRSSRWWPGLATGV